MNTAEMSGGYSGSEKEKFETCKWLDMSFETRVREIAYLELSYPYVLSRPRGVALRLAGCPDLESRAAKSVVCT